MNKRQGLRIRHALENAGLSYAEIARRLRVSRQHVSQVASGVRGSMRVRRAIIDALGGRDPWAGEPAQSGNDAA